MATAGVGGCQEQNSQPPPLGCLAPPSQALVILRIFSASPTLVPLGQSPGRAEIFLDPGHQAWDLPQEPRVHLKMLCVMETFKCALQLRIHSGPRAIPRFTVTCFSFSIILTLSHLHLKFLCVFWWLRSSLLFNSDNILLSSCTSHYFFVLFA